MSYSLATDNQRLILPYLFENKYGIIVWKQQVISAISGVNIQRLRYVLGRQCHPSGNLTVPYVGYNKIMKTSMSALKLGGELWWHEAGPMRDMLVEHNYIANCNILYTLFTDPDWDGSVIYVTSDVERHGPYVNSGLVVRNNVFTDNYGTEVVLNDCRDCQFYDNVCPDLGIREIHCSNITVNGKPNQSR